MTIRSLRVGRLLIILLAAVNLAASIQPIGTIVPFSPAATDFAIDGPGWFVVRDPVSGVEMFTRYGDFHIDQSGFLGDFNGLRVQGFTDSTLTNRGDVRVDSEVVAYVTSFSFETNGFVRLRLNDGTEMVRGQILLQNFGAPEKLARIKLHLFYGDAEALPLPAPLPPGVSGLGTLRIAALDLTPTPPLLMPLPDARRAGALAEGVITATQNNADLAIRGPGCFLLRDPRTSELSVTRAGFFLIDRDGYIITADNQRLQGITNVDEIWMGGVGEVGDVNLNANPIGSTARVASFAFQRNGDVAVRLADGSEFTTGKILLYNFRKPERLRPAAFGRFKNIAPAGPFALENVGSWARNGTRLEPGLELINVTPELLRLRNRFSFFVQGYIERTGAPAQLALNGTGFFRLRDPISGRIWVSRNGDFHLGSGGFLENARGWRVQGYSDNSLAQVGDVQVNWQDPVIPPGGVIAAYSFDRKGHLHVTLTDGTSFIAGQVLVQSFREAFRLIPVGNGLYGNVEAALPLAFETPGSNGNGNIVAASLEVLEPREVLTLPRRNGFRFSISGEPGSRWVVQANDNRWTWHTIGMIAHVPFESEFCDPAARLHPRRFYRVVGSYPPGDFAELPPKSNVIEATYR